jgi:hypothetical protein
MLRRTLLIALLGLFLASCVANYLYLIIYVSPSSPDYTSLLGTEIVLSHGVPLGMLIGGTFAKRAAGGRIPMALAVVAVVLSMAWIGFVSSAWVGYPDRYLADALLAKINEQAKVASIFIGGVLSYLCGVEVKE